MFHVSMVIEVVNRSSCFDIMRERFSSDVAACFSSSAKRAIRSISSRGNCAARLVCAGLILRRRGSREAKSRSSATCRGA
jgi:hypothetical protein